MALKLLNLPRFFFGFDLATCLFRNGLVANGESFCKIGQGV